MVIHGMSLFGRKTEGMIISVIAGVHATVVFIADGWDIMDAHRIAVIHDAQPAIIPNSGPFTKCGHTTTCNGGRALRNGEPGITRTDFTGE